MKEVIGIDTESLQNLAVPKDKFTSEKEKQQYIRQLEEMVQTYRKEVQKYRVVVDGLTRQNNKDASIASEVEDINNVDMDFFD